MDDDVHALVARHVARWRPGARTVAPIGRGLDHVAFAVDDELVVRVTTSTDPDERRAAVDRELAVLELVNEHATLPVPTVVFSDADDGVLAYPMLPGAPLLGRPVVDPARLGAALGEFVSSLHSAPIDRIAAVVPRDREPLAVWLLEADAHFRQIADHVPAGARAAITEFLSAPPPPEPEAEAFCHNDLGTEHVLVEMASGAITGIIDWSDAAVADPVLDLARLFRDLGPDTFEVILTRFAGDLGPNVLGPADHERLRFYARCTVLEDIAFGLDTGAHRYVRAGLANLAHTFAPLR